MAKKRGKTGKAKRKRLEKRIGLNRRVVISAFVITFLIIVLLLFLSQFSNKIIVTNLRLEEGDKDYIHFDIKHTFSTDKECYAEITLLQNNAVINTTVRNLGYIKPNQIVSRNLLINFPGGETDYKVDINCK